MAFKLATAFQGIFRGRDHSRASASRAHDPWPARPGTRRDNRRETRPAARRCVLQAAIVFSLLGCMAQPALAQQYPARPIRIVVPFPPGSGPDTVTRLVGNWLTTSWNQQVIVDNRTGAGGNIGAEIAAKATPNGYTLLTIGGNHPIAVTLYPKLGYDLIKDFSPVSLIASAPYLLIVNPSVPAASVKELIALAKAKPGQLRYGSGGSGSTSHLATEMFKSMAGIDIVHVPYKGATPILSELMSGQVHLAFLVPATGLPLVRTGKARAIGVTKSTPLARDLPAVSEVLPGFEASGMYGLLAPAGTPGEIISRVSMEVAKGLKTAEFRERLASIGADAIGSTPQELAVFLRDEIKRYGKVIKEVGVRVD